MQADGGGDGPKATDGFEAEQVQEQEEEQEMEIEQQQEQEMEIEREQERVEAPVGGRSYSRENEDPCPWSLGALAAAEHMGQAGFYAASQIQVKTRARTRTRTRTHVRARKRTYIQMRTTTGK
jgi:hypothetical protein